MYINRYWPLLGLFICLTLPMVIGGHYWPLAETNQNYLAIGLMFMYFSLVYLSYKPHFFGAGSIVIAAFGAYCYLNSASAVQLSVLVFWCAILMMFNALLLQLKFEKHEVVIHIVLYALIVAAALNSIVGLLQKFGVADSFNGFIHFSSLNSAGPEGQLAQANLFGALVFLGVVAIVYMYQLGKVNRYLACAILVLNLVALSFCSSRLLSVYFLFVLLVFLLSKSISRDVKFIFSVSTFVWLVLGFFSSFFTEFFGLVNNNALSRTLNDTSANLRLEMWTAAWQVYKSSPLLGVGFGQYSNAYLNGIVNQVIPPFSGTGIPRHSHNLILQVLSELGLLGLIAVFSSFLSVIYLWWKHSRSWLVVLPCVILIHSMFEFPLWNVPFFVFFLVFVVIFVVARSPCKTTQPSVGVNITAVLFSMFGFLGALFTLHQYNQLKDVAYPALNKVALPEAIRIIDSAMMNPFLFEQSGLVFLKYEDLSQGNSKESLLFLEQLLERYPYPLALIQKRAILRQQGQNEEADLVSQRLNILLKKTQ